MLWFNPCHHEISSPLMSKMPDIFLSSDRSLLKFRFPNTLICNKFSWIQTAIKPLHQHIFHRDHFRWVYYHIRACWHDALTLHYWCDITRGCLCVCRVIALNKKVSRPYMYLRETPTVPPGNPLARKVRTHLNICVVLHCSIVKMDQKYLIGLIFSRPKF